MTLFFGQAFVVFVNNANRIDFPFFGHMDLTGGANGIDNIDPFNFFGWKVDRRRRSTTLHCWARSSLVMILLYFVNESRTGRAWRALREDPLAAEVMSIPVNRLKLMAFVFGAAVARLRGSDLRRGRDGALPGRLRHRPADHDLRDRDPGRGGSLAGVVVGALIVNGVPGAAARSRARREWVFYVAIIVVVFSSCARGGDSSRVRRRARSRSVSRSTRSPTRRVRVWTAASRPAAKARSRSGRILDALAERSEADRELSPTSSSIAAILVLHAARTAVWRTFVLVPTIYWLAFVWENLLIQQTAGATRFILLGALLVVLMNARPQGLFGTARVEIV